MSKRAILYEIVNTETMQKYIGVTTTALSVRWGAHLYRLRHGLANDKLQAAFNEYGEFCFKINIVAKGTEEDMYKLENELTKETIINGYNMVIGGGGPEEMKRCNKFFWDKMNENPEEKKALFEKIRSKTKGQKRNEDQRAMISRVLTGRRMPEHFIENRKIEYSDSGNPNYANYTIYKHEDSGEILNTLQLQAKFGKNKSGLQWLRKIGDVELLKYKKVGRCREFNT